MQPFQSNLSPIKYPIDSIQALRGIAALLVLTFHFRTGINLSFPHLGDTLFINGSVGVDLFFLISGFIVFHVTHHLNHGIRSCREFIIKRICRIVPLYYIVTLMSPGSTLESLLAVGKSLLFIPLDSTQTGPMYGYASIFVGWTLNYEMFFYLLSSIALLFVRLKWLFLTGMILSLTLLPALIFGWNGLDSYTGYNFGNTYLQLATNPILLEFLCGAFIGYVYNQKLIINNKPFWPACLAAAVAFFVYCYATGLMLGNTPLGWMIPSFFLLLTLVEFEKRYGIAWPKLIIYLGTISFSLYLLHNQILHIVEKILKRTVIFNSEYYGVTLVGMAFILTVIVSSLSYRYIEIKLSNKLRTWLFSVTDS